MAMRFHHRAVPIVLAAVLIDTIGFGIVLPVLPALIMRLGRIDLDAATRMAGYLLAVFAVTQFFAGPVLGNLADRFGRRPVLIAAMAAFGLDYLLMAAAPTLAWLFLGRAVAGVAGAIYAPATAVLADVTPGEQRSKVFGYMGAAFGLGFIIGPAIGGLLSDFGPRAPFIAAAVIAGANALVMTLLMPETLATENRRPFEWRNANIIGTFGPLFRSGQAAPLLLAWFLWQLSHNVYQATWAFWAAARFHWDGRAIGWSLAFVGLVMAVVQGGATGPVIARIGERRAVILGLCAGAFTFLVYAFVTAPWQAYAIFVIGSASGMVYPSMNGMLSRMTDPSRQGALQGGVGAMGSVVLIIAPVMYTQTLATGIRHDFPGAAFLLAAILALVALAIVLAKVVARVPDAEAAKPIA